MDNENRIEQILKELEIYWKKNPHMRLGQMVFNFGSKAGFKEPFYLGDDTLLELLKESNKE